MMLRDGAYDVARALLALGSEVSQQRRRMIEYWGSVLQAEVKREAAQPRANPRPRTGGPEGPRLLTGGYNRTIGRRVAHGPTESTVTVGTNDLRAMALENGHPRGGLSYPHFTPAHARVEPMFVKSAAEIPGEATRR